MQNHETNIILDIQNLSCGYGGKPVIEGFSLKVARGESVAIVGPNGSGKSTILKAIYQLNIINSGTITYKSILLNGKRPEEIKDLGISYFMQKNSIFPKLSILENFLLSLGTANKALRNNKLLKINMLFPEITQRLHRPAGLLSGGERQQLAMAMLLAQEADLWLLDEPTAGLDDKNSEYFLNLLKEHAKDKTIIFVEHKTNIVNQLAKRTINLKNL